SVRHAERVLAAFGRAFGCVGQDFQGDDVGGAADTAAQANQAGKPDLREQKQFLDQAAAGLAQDGKVICVRLALFAEMMKGKAWTPAALRAVGGAQGVGVTFLEETFSAASAPLEHRYHQKAARGVLAALLPESGADIKGHRRGADELLAASGYQLRPDLFAELLRILDLELRLITPADDEGDRSRETGDSVESPIRKYELTHDYLVHSLRDWLTRKQRETCRGRAELRLAERSAAWNAKHDARFLPSWWEWPNILLFTKRGKWTTPERRVMRAAGRYHGLRFAGLLVVLVVAVFMGLGAYRRAEVRRAETLAESVFTARADGVPYALDNLRPMGSLAVERLRKQLASERADRVQRLHAAYALADLGEAPRDFLLDQVSTAHASECRNLVAALAHAKETALAELALLAASAAENAAKARYAIVALHLGDHKPAMDALAVRSDPIQRTTLIHAYAAWHGELGTAAKQLRASDEAAFRSGLCMAFGTIAPDTLESAERDQGAEVLLALYTGAPDGGTHSAAGWALRQWNRPLPAIEPTGRPASDQRWFVNRQGMTMVEVVAGKFTMGTPGEATQGDDEQPAHEVHLTRAVYFADCEVTVAQFQRFLADADYPQAEKPKDWKWEEGMKQYSPADDCPIVYVNWFDTVLYCNWLSVKEGRTKCYERTGEKEKVKSRNTEYEIDVWRCNFTGDGYRLPTEAEWEYAARAGSSAGFCYGSDEDLLPQYAWFVVNSNSRTWPGGAKLPSAVGLFDMHGNVIEWCCDWRGTYSVETATDPTGAAAGSGRVLRGGVFSFDASRCRSAFRYVDHPMGRYSGNGFRVLCGR
ncbi:MAG TPA: SUMF1/EgtB/PvdO family nonheme iron enzyme, partial [Pirellulales bacterium]|nr:SUMF1/EgtB/PvdO family nonheme iron enzyme [Pirellulales bacterium]